MKYYEMHETVYKQIQKDGYLSWDKSTSFEDMWLHETNIYLKKLLTKAGVSLRGLNILDLGTGTGTSALFCAKEGAKCVGVEISSTAIDMARKNAHELDLDIRFLVGDILSIDLGVKFNLVIDSTVLHCIVGTEDRKKFYETAKKHLATNGYLFINTMISQSDMSSCFPKDYFHFEDNILWSLGMNEIAERKEINGKSYFAHRTLLSQEDQMKEFLENGFEISQTEISSGSDVKCLIGLLTLKS